jgi:2-dehydropantoate 2-reductase
MRVCIVGAGAIGGFVGARLALAGAHVTLIARGAHLQAIRERGLALQQADGATVVARPALATSDMAAAGPHDVVIAAVKAQSLPALAPAMRALYHADTIVLPMQNGIPWWYFQKHGGPFEGRGIAAVDPDGVLAANIEVERVIGCVVYPAAELAGPGVVRQIEGNRFSLGELDGAKSARVQQVAQLFNGAEMRAPIRTRIRSEIWVKLWGNLAFNPISALSRATLAEIGGFPPARELARAMMLEAQAVAEKLGIEFGVTIEQRIAGAVEVGAHKTSMLQDIEAGKPTEIDALVGAVAELGRLTDTPTPRIDALYACVKLLEQTALGA